MIPKIVDLFSGCGGLTLGFEKAGFEVAFGVELMKAATETVSYNFDYRYGREASHICADITTLDAKEFKNKIGEEGCIVIGGPPCQAYSMAGRGKLNSLGEDRIHTKDARGFLYKDFLRFAFELDARAVIMENVPEAVNFGGINVPEDVCKLLEENGYKAFWTILNSADYGVPQVRERIILFAIKQREERDISLPEPTHMNVANEMSTYSRRKSGFAEFEHFRLPNEGENLPGWVTVGEAFSDLPVLFKNAKTQYKPMALNVAKAYEQEPQNAFQKTMRSWYGYNAKKVTGNAFRNTERDFQIFERMQQGDDYVDASEIADGLLWDETQLYSIDKNVDAEEYSRVQKKIVPVYDREKFNGKWRKLRENAPSHTLVAHLSKDTYSHIHPWEPRGISVREAARLQSFPDDFYFQCSMGDAYKQIGNAVPPLMAYGVAKTVMKAFREE